MVPTYTISLLPPGAISIFLKILEKLKVKNNHPFHAAAGKGDLKTIKKMLKNGRPINERDAFGATPLIIATVSGKIDIVNFLLSKSRSED